MMDPEPAAILGNGAAEHHQQTADEQQSSSNRSDQIALNVEVCQASTSTLEPGLLAEHVREWLSRRSLMYEDQVIDASAVEDPMLQGHIESIRVCDCETERLMPLGMRLLFWQVAHALHVRSLHTAARARPRYQGSAEAISLYTWPKHTLACVHRITAL